MSISAGVYFWGRTATNDQGDAMNEAYCNRAADTPNGVIQGKTVLTCLKEKLSLSGMNDNLVMDPADQTADVEGRGSCGGKSVLYVLHLDGVAQHIAWTATEIGTGNLVWSGGMPAAGLNMKLTYPPA